MNLLFLNIGTQELFILLPVFGFFVYTLYHAITNRTLTGTERAVWIAVILFTSLIGWVAYWLVGKNGRNKETYGGLNNEVEE